MYLDWAAAATGFIGMYFLSKKNKYGFIFHAVTSILWIFVGIKTGAYGLAIGSGVYVFLNLGCFWKWKKSERV